MTPQVDITEEQTKFIHCMKAFFRAADFYAKQWFGCEMFKLPRFVVYEKLPKVVGFDVAFDTGIFESLDLPYAKKRLLTSLRTTGGAYLARASFGCHRRVVASFADFLESSPEVDALYQLELLAQ